jgi:ABC-2 type transport system permease protein
VSKAARRRARVRKRRALASPAAGAAPKRIAQATAARPAAIATKKSQGKRTAAPALPPAAERSIADATHAFFSRTGILNVAAIARRDLTALFVSPVGWVVAGIFIFLVSSFGFYVTVLAGGTATMDGVFGVITSFLIPVLIPLITMRVLAEERSQGTLELLLTSPVRDWELTVAKWLGAYVFYLLLLATTLAYVVLLRMHVSALDLGLIAATYLGLVLVGAASVAIGVLASSLTRNQIIAFFSAMIALLMVWYAGYVIGYFVAPPFNQFFDYIGGFNRYQSFSLGQAAVRDIVYFLTLTLGALFLTTRVLSSRRWR